MIGKLALWMTVYLALKALEKLNLEVKVSLLLTKIVIPITLNEGGKWGKTKV